MLSSSQFAFVMDAILIFKENLKIINISVYVPPDMELMNISQGASLHICINSIRFCHIVPYVTTVSLHCSHVSLHKIHL